MILFFSSFLWKFTSYFQMRFREFNSYIAYFYYIFHKVLFPIQTIFIAQFYTKGCKVESWNIWIFNPQRWTILCAFYLYSEILKRKNSRYLTTYIMRYMPFNAVSDNLVRKSSQGTLQLHPVGMHKSTFFFRWLPLILSISGQPISLCLKHCWHFLLVTSKLL